MKNTFTSRMGTEADIFDLMRVWHSDQITEKDESLFNSLPDLKSALTDSKSVWMLLEHEGRIEGFIWALVDKSQKLAKIKCASVVETISGGRDQAIFWLVQEIVQLFANQPSPIEVLYTTLRPLAYQNDLMRDIGFRILGIFPNGTEVDSSVVNSLSCYYFHDILKESRPSNWVLHPLLLPLYEIVRQECSLPKIEAFQGDLTIDKEFDALPKLDLFKAPAFVAHRFENLRSRQALSSQFYPFHSPNALIADVNQSIEVFVKIFEGNAMATIVGERLELGVNPVELYKTVAHLLRQHGILYVEMINDAADAFGTEALIQAGYLPCSYFPALKSQNNTRRDYVVFARSFKNFFYPDLGKIAPVYHQYLRQYYEYEKIIFNRFIR